jgi:imidazolonepropionase-like amidohydrolase
MKKTCLLSLMLMAFLLPQAQRKALVGGTLVDGFGGKPILNSVILINGETIEKVGRVGELAIPKGTQIISTEGMTVMPGLWDMHVHMMINGHSDYPYWDKKYPPLFKNIIMPASAHQLLMAGVTSARDLGITWPYHVCKRTISATQALSGYRAVPLGNLWRKRCTGKSTNPCKGRCGLYQAD